MRLTKQAAPTRTGARRGFRFDDAFRLAPRSGLPPLRRPLEPGGEIPEGMADNAVLRRDSAFRWGLAAADVLAAAIAVVVSASVVGGRGVTALFFLALPAIVLLSKAAGLYDRDQHLIQKTTLDEAPKLLHVATVGTLVAWFGSDVLVTGEFSRREGVALWLLLFIGMASLRTVARVVVGHTSPAERCLVIGSEAQAQLVREKIAGSGANAEVVGHIPLDLRGASRSVGSIGDLGLLVSESEAERVIVAPGHADGDEEILHAIRLVKSLGVKVSVLPRLFEVVGSSVEFDTIQGVTLLGVRPYGLTTSSRFLKRCLDIAIAGPALVLLSPLIALVAVAIRLDSPGPVFFRQCRIGRNGTRFQILKFRTMEADAEARKQDLRPENQTSGLFKIADDPRVTSVGSWLRKTSLDELPQLINVVRGEMSLVGPRPLVPDEDEKVEGLDRRRLHVPPGMTGYWQILGSTRVPLEDMVKIDYLYGANWSLWHDVKILLRTVPHVAGRRGL